ncbi:MAG: BrnT family toxin [Gammaproteobacteria bacterium]|nr:BrnT family toxin [Gammaproteobacteria bacterium]
MKEIILTECSGFEWDEANCMKNFKKHGVSSLECEQVFFNTPLLMQEDSKHSALERRLYVLGKTDADRKLFIAFTMRNDQIRVISARDMSKQERRIYEQA